MQTFLPYRDFKESARVLDRARLGKQRVETLQILNALTGTTSGWASHPATLMWKGHEFQLSRYGLIMCKEWQSRGYKNTLTAPKLQKYYWHFKNTEFNQDYPEWNNSKKFHKSHRLMLVWKKPEHYLPLFKDIDEVPEHKPEYIWPKSEISE